MSPVLLLALPAALPAADVTAAVHASDAGRHTVQEGETVYDLAQRYGTTVAAIAAANGLADASLILPGQTLTIPSGTTSASSGSASGGGASGSYTVRRHAARDRCGHGDERLGPRRRQWDFRRLLHLPGPVAAPVRGPRARPPSVPPRRRAVTPSGDALSGIATSTGSTVAAIAKASGISPSAYLQVGQVLTIPSRTDRGDSGSSGASSGASSWADTMPSRSEIRDLILRHGQRVRRRPAPRPRDRVAGIGWQQGVTSSVGAIGAMQVMPQSGEWAGSLIGRTLDLRDARGDPPASSSCGS